MHFTRLTASTIAGLTCILLVCGCEDTPADRMTVRLQDDAVAWPLDLNPTTPAPGIDNNIIVTVDFEAAFPDSTRMMEWSQYQVQYTIEGESSPFIAGPLSTSQIEGTSVDLVLLGAVNDQLNWVFERYTGGEMNVAFRVGLAGVFVETQAITLFEDFTATFADYQPTDDPYASAP